MSPTEGPAPRDRGQLAALGRQTTLEVIAATPWSPPDLLGGARGRPGRRAIIDGLSVRFPRTVPFAGRSGLAGALMAAAVGPAAWMRARALRADVVASTLAYPDGAAAVLVARALQLPAVVKVRGPELEVERAGPLTRAGLRLALRGATRLAITCEALRAPVVAFGADAGVIRRVEEGVDQHRFRPQDHRWARRRNGLPVDRQVILYPGPLTAAAGLQTFLEAAEQLLEARSDLTCVVAGDGPLEGRLHQAAERRGTRLAIIPVGQLPQADLAEYLAAADVVAVPRPRLGLPSIIREALASGRPVVAGREGGVDEVVTHPELGRVVALRDPGALAQGLAEVLDGPPVPPASRVARASLPTWDESAGQLLAVLEEAAATTRARLRRR